MTFSLQVRTPAEIAAEVNADRLEAARLECRQRILDVADRDAQANLKAECIVGGLSAADEATFALGVGWIKAMRATWPTLGAVADVTDDSHWPAVPAGVAELAARF